MSRHHGQHRSHEMQALTEREILALIDYLDPDRDQDQQVPSWVVTGATLLVLFLLYAGILWLGQWLFRS